MSRATKAKVVKAEVFGGDGEPRAYRCFPGERLIGKPGFIVRCPHNWTVTATPPARAKKKRRSKK